MGRDWLYKASRGGGGKSINTSSTGCMTAIFNLFDIQVQHHHHPSFISQSSITDSSSTFSLQGIEAPRNSLESPDVKLQTTDFNIPVGRIQIETRRSTFSDDNSPVTKTPNVVARLMGLDLLPEYSSPRPSSSDHHRSHSLPATPRLSTASPDHNGYHHRLSLHVDKENYNVVMARRRLEVPVNNRQDVDHHRSTQNMKQKTRRINRKVGADITNTVSPARNKHRRRDKDLDLLKPKVSPAREKTPLSNPPKLKLLNIKNNLKKPTSHTSSLKEQMKSKTQASNSHQTPPLKLLKDTKIKRIERYDLHQHEKEFFSRKKSGRLPDDRVLNVKNRRKKDMTSSSSSATRLSQKQVSLPSNLNSSYTSNDTHNRKSSAATTTAAAAAGCSFSDGEVMLWSSAFEAEVEGAVIEIESEIFKNLVDEIVTETMASPRSDRVRSHVLFT